MYMQEFISIQDTPEDFFTWKKYSYSPLPNIRPGPNYRLVGDEGSELIRDQDLFTNHLG